MKQPGEMQSPFQASIPTVMKAIRVHSYGDREELRYEEEMPPPRPREGEILIEVYAAGVNPIDWKMREGAFQQKLPFVVGLDFSGVVARKGDELDDFEIGEEVYGHLNMGGEGTYAEFTIAHHEEIALKPRSVDHLHAAAIPSAALTAWQSLFDLAHVGVGHKVLIHGAAGGVGSFAVQLAKWKGAYVIGTASTENHGFLRNFGADALIDYRTTPFEDVVKNVDVVLDTIGKGTQDRSLKVLKKGGTLVSTVGINSNLEGNLDVHLVSVATEANASQLAEIAKLIDTGKIIIPLEKVLPLSEAKKAHELSESGHVRGKIVLKISNNN